MKSDLNNVQREVMNIQRVGGGGGGRRDGQRKGQSHREGGRMVGPYTQSLPSCTTPSGWLVCGVSSGGGWEAR